MNAPVITWIIVITILAAACAGCWQSNRRWAACRERYRQAHGDRLDHLIDDATARFSDRGEDPRNLAWPPHTQARPVSHAPAVTRDPCGCIRLDGALWQPCTRRALADHIDQHADEWAARLAEQDSQ